MKVDSTVSSKTTIQTYFDKIRRIPRLNFQEELELARRIEKGDKAAKKKLIEANLRLVAKIARDYVIPDVSLLDLVQEGNIGLIVAASKYNYRKKVKFSTYAAWWIKQGITRYIEKRRRVIRLPHRKEELLKKMQKTFNILAQKYLRTPSMREVADELQVREQDILTLFEVSKRTASVDSTINDDSSSLLDTYADKTFCPDTWLIEKTMKEQTMRFLEQLLEREKRILLYRFSFFGNKKYTLQSIGNMFGISAETVRQIEKKALRKLKIHADELKAYVYND
ncbi:MAG: RNA polymerase sigma factor RpoD/SigA [Spirochaetota bacterium]